MKKHVEPLAKETGALMKLFIVVKGALADEG